MKFELSRLQGGQSLMARLSFRSKLLLVLFVPFLALVVVAAAGLSDRFDALHAQQQYGDLSGPFTTLDDASRALQNESVVSSWYVASGGAPSAQLTQARDRTNTAVRTFRANEAAFAEAGLSPAALAALDQTNKGFDDIAGARDAIDAHKASAATTRDFFLGVDDNMLDFGERVSGDLASGDVAASMTRVFALQRTQHELARESSISIAVLASGTPQDLSAWVGAQAAQAQNLTSFANTASSEELAAFASIKGVPTPAKVLPSTFPTAGQTPGEYYIDYEQQSRTLDKGIAAVTGVINSTASDHASAALRDVRIYGGLAAFAMLLTLLLIWFVSRAVVRPVRELTAAAREMSQRQLPALVESLRTGGDVSAIQPVRIEVQSEDEIGDLAQAFNDVEAVTLEVAQEQSRLLRKGMGDLFVNLARRNQSLVQRQLELLDDLERNEHDPAALDALFKLDHMATRMRRNAESLLVLSGAEQPRQWQQPIALIDVVRAAAAEIADFPRVELVGIDDDLAVSGRAVSDVAHLLAELLENATSFSPPDSAVVVSGAVSATGFVLAVSDQGIGMPPERIAEANKLLAQPPMVGLALSRALGLHVVGSLAVRHGISVELRPGAPGGLVALVALPTSVLEPRAVKAPRVPQTPPLSTSPIVDGGPSEPLGARREVTRPPDEPPVEEWRREGFADAQSSAPTAPVEPAVPDAQPTFEEPPSYDGPPTFESAPANEPPAADDPPAPPIDAPLPTRVPGQHLTHHPLLNGEVTEVDADPMRPYRVHELLTRHSQGKRRGQMGDGPPESAPSADTPSGVPQETPVPGAPGNQSENGT